MRKREHAERTCIAHEEHARLLSQQSLFERREHDFRKRAARISG